MIMISNEPEDIRLAFSIFRIFYWQETYVLFWGFLDNRQENNFRLTLESLKMYTTDEGVCEIKTNFKISILFMY
jgi:hypothetical protein